MSLSIYTIDTLIVQANTLQDQLSAQLIGLVPPSWTSGEAKKRGGSFWALMTGISTAMVSARQSVSDLIAQLRLMTARGAGLDVVGEDYFGTAPLTALPRQLVPLVVGGVIVSYSLETDDDYRNRIEAELLRERGTLRGVITAVGMITGAAPTVIEPFSTQSAAVYGDQLAQTASATTPTRTETAGVPTTSSIPLVSATGFIVGVQVSIMGFAPVNPVLPVIVTAISGSTLTVSPALSAAPGAGIAVLSLIPSAYGGSQVATATVGTSSTTTVLNVAATVGFAVNGFVAVNGFHTATGQAPQITAISAGVSLTISPALTAAPNTANVVVTGIGQPVTSGLVGVEGPATSDAFQTNLTVVDGSSTTRIRLISSAGVQTGDRVSLVNGVAPASATTVTTLSTTVTSASDPLHVTVASAAGIAAGDQLVITGFPSANGQPIFVQTVSGSVLTLTNALSSITSIATAAVSALSTTAISVTPALSAAPAQGVAVVVTGASPSTAPGYDAFGDTGAKFTFIVNVTSNPKAASSARILSVVDRVRPAGTRGIVTIAPAIAA